ncbi:MAG: hypothetical protein LBT14_13165 [Treponema sp.]|jgi:branched-subunit amino acid transport protein|nr:hypothetical protein [Treponema sp.]
MKVTEKRVLSPWNIFVIYMVASGFLILGFRFLFPAEPAPLPTYARSWRLNQGFLDFLAFFPALALTSLVIPFGLQRQGEEQFSRFSPHLLDRLKGSVITAIVAVVVYGMLFFWVSPLVRDFEADVRFGGNLFKTSKAKALDYAAKDAWPEASQFIALCERIWPESPEIEALRVEAAIRMDEWRINQSDARAEARAEAAHLNSEYIPVYSGIPGERKPVHVTEALEMADTAMQEGRYYDAYWLANLGSRLARRGSPETGQALHMASLAWNAITALEPDSSEVPSYAWYHEKRDGYEALVSEDWIRAYYIFKDLMAKIPEDPDVARFLAISEQGAANIAFFIDEMELTVGEILTGAIFSLPLKFPAGNQSGRVVLRLDSLSPLADFSYGMSMELIAFDGSGNLLYRVEAPYVKILPITIDATPKLLLMMRALDRNDKARRWEPVWTDPDRSVSGNTQLILDLGYEDFLLLSKLRRGLDALSVGELFTAERQFGSYGYISQVFQAEIIYRVAEPVIFLPIAIFIIVIGWRYRAKKPPRYLGVPMLVGLPLVFNGVMFFYRSILNTLGIWVVISLGFSAAIVLFALGTLFLFCLSLIVLAAQSS